MIDLTGRVLLVTGGGQGIGRQIALQAAERGAAGVVITDFRLERAEAVAAEIEAMGSKGLALRNDVSDFTHVHSTVTAAAERFGRIDVLVNNAGNAGPNPTTTMDLPFWEQSEEDWHGYLGTNLYGVLNYSHAVVPHMIEGGWGRVVNIISDAGRVGEPNREAYAAAKAGVAGFTRSLAATLGRHLITANCVAIAATTTPRTEGRFKDEERMKKLLSHYVIRRPGETTDVANMVVFLASDAAPWVTGQTIPVNGGYSFAL